MVNRFLSSMGILLDNLGVKSLRTNDRKRCMVVDTVAVEPVSASDPQTEYFSSIKRGGGGTISQHPIHIPVYKKGGYSRL